MLRNCSLTHRIAGWSDSTKHPCQCQICREHREQWQALAQAIERQNEEFRQLGGKFAPNILGDYL